jgi:trehalose 6-phosphate phosphatase
MSRNIFDRLKEIEKYKNPETIIVTDIDGTISNIQSLPHEAVITKSMRDVLIEIKKKYMLLAIITGRSLNDALKMIDIPGILYVGNHGMEYQRNNTVVKDEKTLQYIPKIKELYENLKTEPSIMLPGIILENKNACLSIHYRLSENPQVARKNILQTLKNFKVIDELQIKEGKKIIEVRPPGGNDKGVIIKKIVNNHRPKNLIYLGDDITDIDAFKELTRLSNNNDFQGISIAVQSDETPDSVLNTADYNVKSVDDVQKFFNWLLN